MLWNVEKDLHPTGRSVLYLERDASEIAKDSHVLALALAPRVVFPMDSRDASVAETVVTAARRATMWDLNPHPRGRDGTVMLVLKMDVSLKRDRRVTTEPPPNACSLANRVWVQELRCSTLVPPELLLCRRVLSPREPSPSTKWQSLLSLPDYQIT